MSSVFNINAIGFKKLHNLSLNNIKDEIKNNRIVISINENTESYDLILPNNAPTLNKNYLVVDNNGFLSWDTPVTSEVLPTSPSGPPLIYYNNEYIFSPNISNMHSITNSKTSSIIFNENDDTVSINSNNTFFNLFSNIITLGFLNETTPAIEIMMDKIVINKPLVIGNYKIEIINDELIITKFDNNLNKYVPGVVII